MSNENEKKTIFGKVANYKELHVYQKAEVLVLLTDVFCKRFLPPYGDRRVDQMNMAARCGKQNIVEGCEDGQTSSQMEVNLVNVGRASFQELREDYADYLKRNNLPVWDKTSAAGTTTGMPTRSSPRSSQPKSSATWPSLSATSPTRCSTAT